MSVNNQTRGLEVHRECSGSYDRVFGGNNRRHRRMMASLKRRKITSGSETVNIEKKPKKSV